MDKSLDRDRTRRVLGVDLSHRPCRPERYRQRREHTVREIAMRAARQVKMTGDAITLDAMQPFERRAIHLALEGDPDVTSSSIGEEPERRVVVGPRKSAEQ